MTTSEHRQQRLGSLLVFLQFSLILVLGWLALPGLMTCNRPTGALLFAVIGLALGIWALSVNKVGNFNIHPSPKVGGDMVCEGPYRWIRHPMYTSVLVCGAACAWLAESPWGWLALSALAVVLFVKSIFEERWMLAARPAYASYRTRTWRFVPGVF